jgi:hypothetical protein
MSAVDIRVKMDQWTTSHIVRRDHTLSDHQCRCSTSTIEGCVPHSIPFQQKVKESATRSFQIQKALVLVLLVPE